MLKTYTNWKRLLSLLLAMAMVLSMAPFSAVTASAEETNEAQPQETTDIFVPADVVVPELVVDLPEITTSGQALSFFSGTGPALRDGNYANWIDRLDLTDYPEATAFYNWLVDNATGTGALATAMDGEATTYTVFVQSGTAQIPDGADVQVVANTVFAEKESWFAEMAAYITAVYSAFDRDHPEVFWLSGSSRVSYGMSNIRILGSAMSYDLTVKFVLQDSQTDIRAVGYRDAAAIQSASTARDVNRDAILATLTGTTRYEQIRQLNAWLTEHNCYNSCSDLSTIGHECRECTSALEGRTGENGPVCEAYARALKVLCDELDIPCVLVDGDAGGAHMWNYVQMEDGNWYAVDVTWNDPTASGITDAVSGYENENYLLIGSDTLGTSRTVQNTVTQNGLAFLNGPVLSEADYDPNAAEPYLAYRNLQWEYDENGMFTGNLYEVLSDGLIAVDGLKLGFEEMITAVFYLVDGENETPVIPEVDGYAFGIGGIGIVGAPREGEVNADYFCALYSNADRGSATLRAQVDGIAVSASVSVRIAEIAAYSSPELGEDNLIDEFSIDPLSDQEQVFYLGYTGEGELTGIVYKQWYDIDYSSLVTVEAVAGKSNVYKVTVDNEKALEFCYDGPYVDLTFAATVDGGEQIIEILCSFVQKDRLVAKYLSGGGNSYYFDDDGDYHNTISLTAGFEMPMIFFLQSVDENGGDTYTPVNVTAEETGVVSVSPITDAEGEYAQYFCLVKVKSLGEGYIAPEGITGVIPLKVETAMPSYSFHSSTAMDFSDLLGYQFAVNPDETNVFYLRVGDGTETNVSVELTDGVGYVTLTELGGGKYSITLNDDGVAYAIQNNGFSVGFSINTDNLGAGCSVYCSTSHLSRIYYRGLCVDEDGRYYDVPENGYSLDFSSAMPNSSYSVIFFREYKDENGETQYVPVHPTCSNTGVTFTSLADQAVEGQEYAQYFYKMDLSGADWDDTVEICDGDFSEVQIPITVELRLPDMGFFTQPEFKGEYYVSIFEADASHTENNVVYFGIRDTSMVTGVTLGDSDERATLESVGTDGKWYKVSLKDEAVYDAARDGSVYGISVNVNYRDGEGNTWYNSHSLNYFAEMANYLSARSLYDYGYGYAEDVNEDCWKGAYWNPGDRHNVIFYWNYKDEAGNWVQEPVHPDGYSTEAFTLTRLTSNVAEGEPNAAYFYQIEVNSAAVGKTWYITYGEEGQIPLPIYADWLDPAFYTDMEFTEDKYTAKFAVDPDADENVIYFGFRNSEYSISDMYLNFEEDQAKLETIEDGKWYKITVYPKLAQEVAYYGSIYNINVDFTLTDSDGNSWGNSYSVEMESTVKEFLLVSDLYNDGNGWYENGYDIHEDYISMTAVPGKQYGVIFYRCYLESGEWKTEPVKVTSSDADKLKLTLVTESEDHAILEDEEYGEYFYILEAQSAGWDSTVSVSETGKTYQGVSVEISRPDVGFYTKPEFANQNYLASIEADPLDGDYVFYMGFENMEHTVTDVYNSNGYDGITVEAVEEGKWYKITITANELRGFVRNGENRRNIDFCYTLMNAEDGEWSSYETIEISIPYTEFLSCLDLSNDGSGWYASEYDVNNSNLTLQQTPGKARYVIFYRNYLENGEWKAEPVEVTSSDAAKLKLTSMSGLDGYTILENEAYGEFFYVMEAQTAGWDSVVFVNSEIETSLGVSVDISRPDVGFYSKKEFTNESYLPSITLDSTEEDYVFYLGMESEEYVIQSAYEINSDEGILVECEEASQWCKITLDSSFLRRVICADGSSLTLNMCVNYTDSTESLWGTFLDIEVSSVIKEYMSFMYLYDDNGWYAGEFDSGMASVSAEVYPGNPSQVIFYRNYLEDGQWKAEPVKVTSSDTTKLIVTPMSELEDYTIREGEAYAEYFYVVEAQTAGWDSIVTVNSDAATCLGVDMFIQNTCTHEHDDTPGIVKSPTCTEQGYTTYTCTICGETYQDDYVDVLGHTVGEGVVTAPTCTEQGYTTYNCTVCGETYQDDYVGSTGHSFGEDDICTVCGSEMMITINMDDSAYDSWNNAAIEVYADGILIGTATIEEGGNASWSVPYDPDKEYTFYWVSGGWNYECSFEIMLGNDVIFTASQEDCGAYEDGQKLDVCLHQYGDGVVTAPTCTKDGHTTYVCTICGGSYNMDYVEAPGHKLGADDVCDVCGATGEIVIEMTDSANDSWNGAAIAVYEDGTLIGTATVEEGDIATWSASYYAGKEYTFYWVSGSWNQECSFEIRVKDELVFAAGMDACGQYTDQQLLHTIENGCDHSYGEGVVTAPTCTEDGYTTYTCSLCGNSYTGDTVAASGHNYSSVVTAPTCTEAGYTTYTCSNCGDSYTADEVAATGHNYVNGSCTVCGTADPGYVAPAIVQKGRTLSYEDMIYVIDIFDLQGIDLEEVDITTDAGVLTWSVEEYEALSEIVYDEAHANPGLAPYQNTGFYFGSSDGIFTRDLYKEAYYVGYVKLPDGTYIYSEAKLYSPAAYAYNMLSKSSTGEKTKTLCVALLNYISAAQMYFDPSTPAEDLVNVDLSDEQKALTWNVTDLNLAATEIPADKDVARDKTVFAGRGKNLLFEEMISLVSVYVIDTATIEAATECGTIFWTAEQFEALTEAPSIENYGEGTKVTGFNVYQSTDGQWYSAAPAVAPKDMAETEYYILGYVIHADGSVSYSGVMSYTFEQYISNMATNAKMGEFAQRLYYYERAAQAALG